MKISRNLFATIHIVAIIAAATAPAVAAEGGFARDAAGTEGRYMQPAPTRNTIREIIVERDGGGVLRTRPIGKPLPPIFPRRGHRYDGGWHWFHHAHNHRVGATAVMVKSVR